MVLTAFMAAVSRAPRSALLSLGSAKAIITPMMASTIRSSIREKPPRRLSRSFLHVDVGRGSENMRGLSKFMTPELPKVFRPNVRRRGFYAFDAKTRAKGQDGGRLDHP